MKRQMVKKQRMGANAGLGAFALGALILLATSQHAIAGPAPALTEIRVVQVASPGYQGGNSWDNVPAGAISTPKDHKGNWILVGVFERGYGQNSTALFNGIKMKLEKSEPLLAADRTVYGYVRYYSLNTSFTSGTITSQSTSINFPVRTLSTRLNVR